MSRSLAQWCKLQKNFNATSNGKINEKYLNVHGDCAISSASQYHHTMRDAITMTSNPDNPETSKVSDQIQTTVNHYSNPLSGHLRIESCLLAPASQTPVPLSQASPCYMQLRMDSVSGEPAYCAEDFSFEHQHALSWPRP